MRATLGLGGRAGGRDSGDDDAHVGRETRDERPRPADRDLRWPPMRSGPISITSPADAHSGESTAIAKEDEGRDSIAGWGVNARVNGRWSEWERWGMNIEWEGRVMG